MTDFITTKAQMISWIYVIVAMILNVIFTVVITIGGVSDLKRMFKGLNQERDVIHKKMEE